MTKKEVIVPADDLVCLGKDKLQELIRCKGCKHWEKSRINYNEYVCYWGGYTKQEDDFCSWAERKEQNG